MAWTLKNLLCFMPEVRRYSYHLCRDYGNDRLTKSGLSQKANILTENKMFAVQAEYKRLSFKFKIYLVKEK